MNLQQKPLGEAAAARRRVLAVEQGLEPYSCPYAPPEAPIDCIWAYHGHCTATSEQTHDCLLHDKEKP